MKCRFCAEEILDAAIVCKHCGRKQIRSKAGKMIACVILIPIGIFALLTIIGSLFSPPSTGPGAQSQIEQTAPFPPGKDAHLINDLTCCLVTKSEEDLNELDRVGRAADNRVDTPEDDASYDRMVAGHRIWLEHWGTAVTVLKTGIHSSGVEVHFADGTTGWVWPKQLH